MRRIVFILAVSLVVLMTSSVVVIACGWGGWLAFLLSDANPFTYKQPTAAAIDTTRQSGDAIIAALERWKAKNGIYPASLQLLVPGELSSIPAQLVGDGTWKYWTTNSQSFTLKFWVGPDYESDWWESGTNEWRVDR